MSEQQEHSIQEQSPLHRMDSLMSVHQDDNDDNGDREQEGVGVGADGNVNQSSMEAGTTVTAALPATEALASIERSVGWYFPEVKLASWDPENEKQWLNGGHGIAHRNLLVSIPNLCCAFGVWLSWSIIASKIQLLHDEDPSLYAFEDWGSPQGAEYNGLLYTLPSVAGLSGGTLRIANSFLSPLVGGRNVVAHSSVLLAIAMIYTAIILSSQSPTFNSLLVGAWLSGTGGGAFASSMSNMSFLYPKRKQGYCLGLNGGFGNLGVCISQLVLPMLMSRPFGSLLDSDSDTNKKHSNTQDMQPLVLAWPHHAGWFWWPLCALSAIAAFVWMSNLPNHGNHPGIRDARLVNIIYYYWIECISLLVAGLVILLLVWTQDKPLFTETNGRKTLQASLLVVTAAVLQHIALRYASPTNAMESLRQQAQMFQDKHTYIMTLLYTMSFGSFIGFSGAFPKLITDLFGYVTAEGCYYDHDDNNNYNNINTTTTGMVDSTTTTDTITTAAAIFVQGGTEFDCLANNGTWGTSTVTNPDAPNVFHYAWMGPAIGSLIRPIGGILADKHGGAKVTQLLIVWCTIATTCLGIVVQKTEELQQPEHNFATFCFLFLNVFFCTGALNGTIFRTIGVLYDSQSQLAGPVLGWSSAIASYGAFVIPTMFSVSISTGHAERTLYWLAGYYAACGILNYYYYVQKGCEKPGV